MIHLSPPTPLWRQSREPLDDTHAIVEARAWLDSGAWGLLLLGGVGRGKSMAAAWLWHRLRERSQRTGGALWLRARHLQRLPWGEREAKERGTETRGSVLARCATNFGLIVDELGAEDDKTSQAIGDVLEQRGDDRARTVITTNLNGKQFLARYGDRLISRLRSGGVTDDDRARWAVSVKGADLRSRAEIDAPAPDPALEFPTADQIEEICGPVRDGLRLVGAAAAGNADKLRDIKPPTARELAIDRAIATARARGALAWQLVAEEASQGCQASLAIVNAVLAKHPEAQGKAGGGT